MSESYLLCEGYHDRAFWAGLLLHLGCVDPGSARGRRLQVLDAFGDPVNRGTFAFRSKTGAFVRIVPAGGKDKIPPLLRNRLKESVVKPLSRVIVNVDSDLREDDNSTVGTPLSRQSLDDVAREFDPHLGTNADGDLVFSSGTMMSIVQWQSPDAPAIGLPEQQTLERLICSAFFAVYPSRALAVQNWLDSRPEAPTAGPKEFAWSYLAGWHAAVGSYEGFCSMVWKDSLVAAQLQNRLEVTGIWRVAEAIASR